MFDVDLMSIAIFLGVLLVSASLHEVMHAYVALRLGDDLAHSRGRISLNPMAHIDPFLSIILPTILMILGMPVIFAAKPVPINTARVSGEDYGLALIGVAGPLTNLVLAFLGGFVFAYLTPGSFMQDVMELFVSINVSLFVFNMLPIPPLDGSRVLYAIAPSPVQRVMERIEAFGLPGLIMILLLLGSFISPVLIHVHEVIMNVVM